MNIPIQRTEETIIIPKVVSPKQYLTLEQFEQVIQANIDAGVSADERIGKHNFVAMHAEVEMVQSASEDGSHTVFVPMVCVQFTLK